jgi:outer membrane protein insertion porin family
VAVAWDIREGEPAYINRVSVAGNTKTFEDVIRERIFLLPGDVYNEDLLIQSYHSIMALGFFEAPMPMPRIEPNDEGDVDITFEVNEKQTGSFSFGTAIGGGTGGLAGFLGYDEPNLFGQAKAGHLRWEFGRWSNNFEASYSDPAVAGSRVGSTVSLFSARDRFNPFRAEGQRRRTGAGVRFGLPLPTDPRFTRLVVGYSLSRTTYESDPNVQSDVFGLPPGLQSTVTVGLSRNTLNHPIFPTAGTRQHVEGNFSGGPLGGDGDFQKYSFETNWFVPVGQVGGSTPGSRPIRFTLGVTAEGGALVGDASRFPFERFWMGGVQFGRPLRGYGEATITPDGYIGGRGGLSADRFGNAYLRMSAEYAIRFNDNLSASLFYDAGNVWRDVRAVNPTRLLRGAGVGVSLVTPFGPIGLDYAYGFDKDVPGWQLHFKFGPGF